MMYTMLTFDQLWERGSREAIRTLPTNLDPAIPVPLRPPYAKINDIAFRAIVNGYKPVKGNWISPRQSFQEEARLTFCGTRINPTSTKPLEDLRFQRI